MHRGARRDADDRREKPLGGLLLRTGQEFRRVHEHGAPIAMRHGAHDALLPRGRDGREDDLEDGHFIFLDFRERADKTDERVAPAG